MTYTVTVIGSYPKPPHEGGEFRLRKALQAMDRGEAGDDDVRAAQDGLVREVIDEQVAAGVDLVTDGQVRWDDALTRFADGLENVSVSGLLRYFDNNTYFRQPVVKGPIERTGPVLVEEFRFAASVSPVPVKAVLPGPYTFAALSRDESGGGPHDLLARLAAVLNAEARDLAAAGATVIQFDEPALARVPGQPPGDLDRFAAVAGRLLDGVEATTVLATYFGDVAPLGPGLFRLPFDVFGLDLVAGPSGADLLSALPEGRGLQAGVVDARNTRLEDAGRVAGLVRDLERRAHAERVWLAPSCGLEYLPRDAAERKLRLLKEVKEVLDR
jgi:5-methyltetrahydropteroyltriglutamate--homocysteine methyltransferase